MTRFDSLHPYDKLMFALDKKSELICALDKLDRKNYEFEKRMYELDRKNYEFEKRMYELAKKNYEFNKRVYELTQTYFLRSSRPTPPIPPIPPIPPRNSLVRNEIKMFDD